MDTMLIFNIQKNHNASLPRCIREDVESELDGILDLWRDRPLGQMVFSNGEFPKLFLWLMLNHEVVSILIYLNTNDIVANYRHFLLWLEEKMDLNITLLETGNTKV